MKTVPTGAAPFREAEIDLAQLARNVELFRGLNEGRPVFADVGANAWGHGLDIVLPVLVACGVHGFVVARLEEAEHVRGLEPDAIIITTQHSFDEEFDRAARLAIVPAVRSRAEFDRSMAGHAGKIVLVADDGLRLPALSADEVRAFASEAREGDVVVLLWSELAVVGAELFGVSEHASSGDESGYCSVLRLWAPVTATKRVGHDEGVSYGYTYRTVGETTLALVTLGYADGISRSGGNHIHALVGGSSHQVAGRMAMDAFMVDLGNVPAPPLGTEATVLGEARRGEPTAFEHGQSIGMHSAEVTTRLAARPHRYPREETQ